MSYEIWWKNFICKRKKALLEYLLYFVFYLLSVVYSIVWEIYLSFYKFGILKKAKINGKIISFGNITLGGSGKTQMILKFLEDAGKDKKVAVLLRGYKSRVKKDMVIIGDGKGNILPPSFSDEGNLIAVKNRQSVVIAGKKRTKSAEIATEKLNCTTVVLDDGYQYLKLKKDIEIVLIDASVPFENYKVFPAGILRERFKNISRADVVIITKVNFADDILKTRKAILDIRPDIPIIETEYRILHLEEIFSNKVEDIKILCGRKVVAISGIANPDVFEEWIKRENPLYLKCYRFPDHHFYTERDFSIVKEDETVVTTEKDAVKIKELKINIPIYSTILGVEITKGEEIWKKIIE